MSHFKWVATDRRDRLGMPRRGLAAIFRPPLGHWGRVDAAEEASLGRKPSAIRPP